MGAWFSVRDYIQWTLNYIGANNNKISYIGRNPESITSNWIRKKTCCSTKEIIKKVFE